MLTNAQIKEIKKLNEKSKARREAGLFVIEGPKMFSETPIDWVEKVYVTQDFLEEIDMEYTSQSSSSTTISQMIQWMDHEIITWEQMCKISDTQTPQGILCILRQPSYSIEELLEKETGAGNSLYMVLEDIQDPGNLGTIFRTAEGAGVKGIIMSRQTVDIFNPKTIRSTMGSIYRVPFIYVEDIKDTIMELKAQKVSVYAAHLKGECFHDEVKYGDTAFLIGNEGNGLKDETAALADTYIKIPMKGQLESLNAAVASAVLMYEWGRQNR